MSKTILITGSTDGIGLEAAKRLLSEGHRVLLHGRSPEKLARVTAALSADLEIDGIEGFVADLSRMDDVEALAQAITDRNDTLDVLINNAGVFRTPEPLSSEGLDVRFAVNTLAPYLLTQRLLPVIAKSGRVINLSSAAQAPVDPDALAGRTRLSDDFAAYAQSKLALTMWSRSLALSLGDDGPLVVSVNPGSMLGTKMVKEGFGVAGGDIGVGADILVRAALSDEFAGAAGQYFDNDAGRFAPPHPDALDADRFTSIENAVNEVLMKIQRTGRADS